MNIHTSSGSVSYLGMQLCSASPEGCSFAGNAFAFLDAKVVDTPFGKYLMGMYQNEDTISSFCAMQYISGIPGSYYKYVPVELVHHEVDLVCLYG
jgi:hypothetical protein